MRRYIVYICIVFTSCLMLIASCFHFAVYADKQVGKIKKSITVYTTLPIEHAAIVADAYERSNHVKINFVFFTESELLKQFQSEQEISKDKADAILTDKENLIKLSNKNAFSAYSSEETDIIAGRFKDLKGAWVGVWYDPIIFCANSDYLKTLAVLPTSWQLLSQVPNIRIGITDFLAADAAANLLYTLIAEYDEQRAFALLKQLHPKVVQYSKYLSTPVRMAGMGEVDISIAVQSESIRYVNDSFPVTLIYPKEGTAFWLTGIGMLKNSQHKEEVQSLIKWLLSDDAQIVLQKNMFFFMPTNPLTMTHKYFSARNIILFDNYSDLKVEQKATVLDRWVKDVRIR